MKTGSRSSLWMTTGEVHGSRTAVGPKEELWAVEAGGSEGKGGGQKEYRAGYGRQQGQEGPN